MKDKRNTYKGELGDSMKETQRNNEEEKGYIEEKKKYMTKEKRVD